MVVGSVRRRIRAGLSLLGRASARPLAAQAEINLPIHPQMQARVPEELAEPADRLGHRRQPASVVDRLSASATGP